MNLYDPPRFHFLRQSTALRRVLRAFNPNHDERGRFSSGPGGGKGPPDDADVVMRSIPRVGGRSPLEGKPDTQQQFKKGGKYDPEREATVHNPIYQGFFKDKDLAPDGKPVLYMTGGGYGSGKSTLLEKFPDMVGFPEKDSPLAVKVDPDAVKAGIPEYQAGANPDHPDPYIASYVHEESSDVAKEGIRRALSSGYNAIYDTSADTDPEKLMAKVEGFRQQGATRVEAHYAFPGSIQEGQDRADYRAEHSSGLRRYVDPEVLEANHHEVVRCWVATAQRGTFDKQTLWSTAGKFGDPPALIASASGGKITVHDPSMWERFLSAGEFKW